jgi:hypothetical protein
VETMVKNGGTLATIYDKIEVVVMLNMKFTAFWDMTTLYYIPEDSNLQLQIPNSSNCFTTPLLADLMLI